MQPSAFDPSTDLELRVGSEPDPPESGQPVRWVFAIANRGVAARDLTFPSAQRGEVVLVDHAGAEAYRWSSGRLFAAALATRELTPGEEWSFGLEDMLEVPPGRYALRASVPARPAPPAVSGEITVYPGR